MRLRRKSTRTTSHHPSFFRYIATSLCVCVLHENNHIAISTLYRNLYALSCACTCMIFCMVRACGRETPGAIIEFWRTLKRRVVSVNFALLAFALSPLSCARKPIKRVSVRAWALCIANIQRGQKWISFKMENSYSTRFWEIWPVFLFSYVNSKLWLDSFRSLIHYRPSSIRQERVTPSRWWRR